MKEWLKKKWPWIIGAAVLIVGGPIIINELYKTGKGYLTLWGAAEILSYYGMILAAIISIAGVYITVYISNKNYRQDAKNRILPYIAINVINHEYDAFLDGFDFDDSDFNTRKFIPDDDSDCNYMTFVIDKKNAIRVNVMTEKERTKAYESTVKWIRGKDGTLYIRDADYVSIPFVIENVGNGPAINMHMGFASTGNKPHYGANITLKQNQTVFIYIFSEKNFNEIKGDYSFDIYYDDISGNHYVQKYPVRIYENESGNRYKNIAANGNQLLLKEDTTNADT